MAVYTKDLTPPSYYGFKLGLRVSAVGMITHFPLLNARSHAVTHTNSLVEGFNGLCPADKGFIDPFRQPLLQQRYGVKIGHSRQIKHERRTPSRPAKVLLTDS